uniref:Potassium channel domain-containing protein n=1 Tax=Compsopogon caeruleus TaxID=31354 RepID=A0A7S1XFF2_9RHOD
MEEGEKVLRRRKGSVYGSVGGLECQASGSGCGLNDADEVERRRLTSERWEERRAVIRALAGVTIFLMAGAAFYHVWEGWSWVSSAYFCVVVATTVGYGDLTPSTPVSKLFTVVYVVVAVMIILAALASLFEQVMDSQERLLVNRLLNPEGCVDDLAGCQSMTASEKMEVLTSFGTFFIIGLVGSCILGHLEHLSWLDSIYFTVVTASTVGFGDMEPNSESTRLFASIWILISTISLAHAIGTLSSVRAAVRQRVLAYQTIHTSLSRGDYRALDRDQDGQISQIEYLTGMLVKLGNVDQILIDEILERFHDQDRDRDGEIDMDEAGLALQD